MTRNNEIFMSGTSLRLRIIKNLSNIGQFTEINQDNQNIFDHSGAKQISTNQILIFFWSFGCGKRHRNQEIWNQTQFHLD